MGVKSWNPYRSITEGETNDEWIPKRGRKTEEGKDASGCRRMMRWFVAACTVRMESCTFTCNPYSSPCIYMFLYFLRVRGYMYSLFDI